MPVVRDLNDFDCRSGNLLERLVFNHRSLFVAACILLTLVLGLQAVKLTVNTGFDKMIPQDHPYIQNYFENRTKLGGMGNTMRIVVENTKGDVFDPAFLEVTRQINDAVFLTPGVERSFIKSIWMASVRWTEVTEEGFLGGQVMPADYDGSPRTIENLKMGIRRAGIVGNLVSNDYKSVMIVVPLLEKNMETNERLDYGAFARHLEQEIRQKYESQGANGKAVQVKIHIVGFAKLVGDLIDGLMHVATYFGIAFAISALIIYLYTRCLRSTAMVLICSLVAVIWELGIVYALHLDLDPYSVLVPFLVFAIGVSHGAQKMNGIMQDVGRGTDKYVAARYTFRRLFLAGVTALAADAVAFVVLTVIDIPVIKELALVASIGVALLVVTNLLLLPVMLSYLGVSQAAAMRSLAGDGESQGAVWTFLNRFTEKRWATGAILVSAALTVVGYVVSLDLKTGDLDPGAPELRSDSRYNRDMSYINAHYGLSTDQFISIVKTPKDGCAEYRTVKETERFAWQLRQVPGVQSTTALSDQVAKAVSGSAEGNPKWLSVPRNPMMIGAAIERTLNDNPDAVDKSCSTIPVIAYLTDHKAETLHRIVTTVEAFAQQHNDKDIRFLLAAGPAGIEAVTNIVVEKASRTMLFYVYGAVILLCFITFRNWRAVLVAVIPLIVTSVLCEALMVVLGIGVKVATLPVIALGVGIGVDYALYLLSVQLSFQRAGMPLAQAYKAAAAFTGKVVALVGLTLAAGVVTWAWSPIKFQADMGILLTFMFLWNMIGALVLIPALSCFLLNNPQHVRRTSTIEAALVC
ncbi:MAG: MMPL family transporter [Telluria sp.]|nr:MMPL family transporter [Telluria sp.]